MTNNSGIMLLTNNCGPLLLFLIGKIRIRIGWLFKEEDLCNCALTFLGFLVGFVSFSH